MLKVIDENNLAIADYLLTIAPYCTSFNDEGEGTPTPFSHALQNGSDEMSALFFQQKMDKTRFLVRKTDPVLEAILHNNLKLLAYCVTQGYQLAEKDLEIACWNCAKPELIKFLQQNNQSFTNRAIADLFHSLKRTPALGESPVWEELYLPTFSYVLFSIKDNAKLRTSFLIHSLLWNHMESFELFHQQYQILPLFSHIQPYVNYIRRTFVRMDEPRKNFSCDRILSYLFSYNKYSQHEVESIPPALCLSILYSMFNYSDCVYRNQQRENLIRPSRAFIGYASLLQTFLEMKNIQKIERIRDNHANTALHYLCHPFESAPATLIQINQELASPDMNKSCIAFIISHLIYLLIQRGSSISALNNEGKMPGAGIAALRKLLVEVEAYAAKKATSFEDEHKQFDFAEFKLMRLSLLLQQPENSFSGIIYSGHYSAFFGRAWRSPFTEERVIDEGDEPRPSSPANEKQ